MAELPQYREDIEALVAMVEVDMDLFPQEVDAFLRWIAAFVHQRLAEREPHGGGRP